jgi:hypothetical protein
MNKNFKHKLLDDDLDVCSNLQKKRKRLVKSGSTIENLECVICLGCIPKGDYAKLNSCSHHFCFNCINEWSKNCSACPLCKKKFTQITHYNKKGKIEKKIKDKQFGSGILINIVANEISFSFTHSNKCIECKKEIMLQNETEEKDFLVCTTCHYSVSHMECIFYSNADSRNNITDIEWNCKICVQYEMAKLLYREEFFNDVKDESFVTEDDDEGNSYTESIESSEKDTNFNINKNIKKEENKIKCSDIKIKKIIFDDDENKKPMVMFKDYFKSNNNNNNNNILSKLRSRKKINYKMYN